MSAPVDEPPYNPDVPNPKDYFDESQPTFQNNFKTFFDAFNNNHISLDALSNAGNHTFLQLLQQASDSKIQSNVGEISAYVRTIEKRGSQIFLKYQGNQEEFQYTSYQIYALGPTNTQVSYFSFLPGNIIIYFGSFVAGTTNVILDPALGINVISINLCPIGVSNVANPLFPPAVTGLTRNSLNFYNSFNIVASFLDVIPACYYFVAVNI